MLKNQDTVPEPQPTSGVPRVTPEELTQALAAIEARKQAEAARLAGTIPIDQAISDLHLDTTSDEIWAEVQAQRAKATATSQEPPLGESPAPPKNNPFWNSPFQNIPAFQGIPLRVNTPVTRRRGWPGLLAPVLVIGVLMSAGVIPQPWGHSAQFIPPIFHSAAAPILRPVSSFADGTDFYADDAALVQISEGKPLNQIVASKNETGNRWTLLKTNGHVYLRGYIESAHTLQPLEGKALNVYNDDNSGELRGDLTSNITLRVDNTPLQKSSGDDSFSGITIPNFQADPMTTLSPWR